MYVQPMIALLQYNQKAFDTVNRELLFIILIKLGCPAKFIRIIKNLYTNVHAKLIVDGELTVLWVQ